MTAVITKELQETAPTAKAAAPDLLRIFATAMVLLVHAGQTAGTVPYTDFGAYGVQLFFILSGYFGCASLVHRPAAPAYYKGRIARILPLYWLILAVRYFVDVFTYAAQMPLPQVFSGPCGPRYLRYFFFLQMFIPSEDWALWNNRSALWTMSAFAFFYLLAPILHRLLNNFAKSFGFLLLCLAGKGVLSRLIERAMAGYPETANASQFSAWNPPAVLYCFIFGWALYHALQEGHALFYGAFCLTLPILFSFERCAQECLFTALLLLALVLPFSCPERLRRLIRTMSEASFFLYLLHPLLLQLFPRYSGSIFFSAVYLVLICTVITAVCLLLYHFAVRRFEAWAAQRILSFRQ